MTVSSFYQTDYTVDDPATYKAAIDGNFSVLGRIAAMFTPFALSTAPDMAVRVSSGAVFNGVTLTNVAAQTSSAVAASSAGSTRIDRAIVSKAAGVLAIVTGTPSTAPAAPAITSSYLPVAQILISSGTTFIDNSLITDERTLYVF